MIEWVNSDEEYRRSSTEQTTHLSFNHNAERKQHLCCLLVVILLQLLYDEISPFVVCLLNCTKMDIALLNYLFADL